MWVLNRIEDHDQRSLRGAIDDLLDAEIRCAPYFGDHPLMDTATRVALERFSGDAADANATLARERKQLFQAVVGTFADTKLRDATRAECF